MSNLKAQLSVTVRGNRHPDGFSIVDIPWNAESAGEIDIPDTSVADTSFAVPFGAVGTEATLLVIKNTNNQDMKVKINGSSSLYRLPPGGVAIFATPVAAGATPIASAAVLCSGTQSGAGQVKYLVLGDPT